MKNKPAPYCRTFKLTYRNSVCGSLHFERVTLHGTESRSPPKALLGQGHREATKSVFWSCQMKHFEKKQNNENKKKKTHLKESVHFVF